MTPNKILVTGANGLVGSRFVELIPHKDQLITPEFPEFDLTKPELVKRTVSEIKPGVILHFAAYTNVGDAEKERGNKKANCWQINVEGTKNLLTAAKTAGAFFIYISTDMVFPGSRADPGPYPEDHRPEINSDKISWYGYTKGVAENLAAENEATIVRIIYPVRSNFADKLDYLRKTLQLYDQQKLYPLFDDQFVSLTFIDELCLALQNIIRDRLPGVFHVSSPDTSTPFALVSYLLEKSRSVKDVVKKSSLDEFLTTVNNPVRYPKFGGLKSDRTQSALGMYFSSTTEIIDQLVRQGIKF